MRSQVLSEQEEKRSTLIIWDAILSSGMPLWNRWKSSVKEANNDSERELNWREKNYLSHDKTLPGMSMVVLGNKWFIKESNPVGCL